MKKIKSLIATSLCCVMFLNTTVFALEINIQELAERSTNKATETFDYPKKVQAQNQINVNQPSEIKLPQTENSVDEDEVLYGQPIEISQNTKVYKTGDHTYKSVFTGVPYTYGDYSLHQKIDNTLVQEDNEHYTNKANSLKMYFPKKMARGEGISIDEFKLIPVDGDYSKSSTKDNAILYNNVYDGIDVQYTAHELGVKHDIILNKFVSRETFSYKLDIPQYTWSKLENGVINIYKQKENGLEITLTAPIIIDAMGKTSKCEIASYENSIITVKVDSSWIVSPERAFPIKISNYLNSSSYGISVNTISKNAGIIPPFENCYAGNIEGLDLSSREIPKSLSSEMLFQIDNNIIRNSTIPKNAKIKEAYLQVFQHTDISKGKTMFECMQIKDNTIFNRATETISTEDIAKMECIPSGEKNKSQAKYGIHKFDIKSSIKDLAGPKKNGLIVKAGNDMDIGEAFYTPICSENYSSRQDFISNNAPKIIIEWEEEKLGEPSNPIEENVDDEVLYGKPIEVNQHSKVYQTGEHTFKTVYSGITNTTYDGEKIDSTLIKDHSLIGGDFYTNKVNDIKVAFSSEMKKGEGFSFNQRNGVSFGLIPLEGDYRESTVKDNAILYNNVYDGIDVQCTAHELGMKQDIILNKFVKKNTFEYYINHPQYTTVEYENGVINLYQWHSDSSMTITSPTMIDAAGQKSDDVKLTYEYKLGRRIAIVTVDERWLYSRERVYPIKISNNIKAPNGAIDVSTLSPTNTDVSEHGNSYVGIMSGDEIGVDNCFFGPARMLIKIDQSVTQNSTIPKSAKIKKAYLQLYQSLAVSEKDTQFECLNINDSSMLNRLYEAITYKDIENISCFPSGKENIVQSKYGIHKYDIKDSIDKWDSNKNGLIIKITSERGHSGGAFYTPISSEDNGRLDLKTDNAPKIVIEWQDGEPSNPNYPIDNTTINIKAVNGKTNYWTDPLDIRGIFANGKAPIGAKVGYSLNDSNSNIIDGNCIANKHEISPDVSAWKDLIGLNVEEYDYKDGNWQTKELFTNFKYNTVYCYNAKPTLGGEIGKNTSTDKFMIYQVNQFDTIHSIANYYGVSLKTIMDDNINRNMILPGSELFIRNPKYNVNKPYTSAPFSKSEYESTNKAEDLLLLGSGLHCEFGLQSVNINTGNFYINQTDATIPDFSGKFSIERAYNSFSSDYNSIFGRGWQFNYAEGLSRISYNYIMYTRSDGSRINFRRTNNGFQAPDGYYYTFNEVYNGGYEIIDAQKIIRHFDESGLLTRITDAKGHATKLGYDENYKLINITSPSNLVYYLFYSADGKVTTISLPDGKCLKYKYDSNDNLVSYKDTMNNEITYSYNDKHQMLSWADGNKQVAVTNVYDNEGKVIKQTNANGNIASLSYAKNKTTLTESNNVITNYNYDNSYRTTKVEYANGSNQQKDYKNNNLSFVVDKGGKKTNYEYDVQGNLVNEIRFDGTVRKCEYNKLNNLTKLTDFDGKQTVFEYDTIGNLIKTINNDNTIETNKYDNQNRLISKIDAKGNQVSYEYNKALVSEIIDEKGNKTQYAYNTHGQLISVVDPTGAITRYIYDGAGHKTGEQAPDSSYAQYVYNNTGLVSSLIDAKGLGSVIKYDKAGNIISITDPAGGVTKYTYDSKQNKLSETNPAGKTTQYVYDSMSRLEKAIDPDGKATTYEYDKSNNHIKTIDSKGNISTITYDPRNNLPKTYTNANKVVTTYEYDLIGNITKQTTEDGNSKSYTYDSMNRISNVTETTGLITNYGYDLNGNLLKTTDNMSRVTTYTYDKLNHPLTITRPNGGIIKMQYDELGRLISSVDALDQKTSYEYDIAGHMILKTDALGKTTKYGYDANGNMVKEIASNGGITLAQYDVLNQVAVVTNPLNNQTSMAYDKSGNISMMQNSLGYQWKYEYNGRGLPVNVTDSMDNVYKMSYDNNGNNIEVITPDNSKIVNEYDSLNRLVKSTDAAGLVTTNKYDSMNRIIEARDNAGNIAINTYDNLGNLIQTKNALNQTTTYTYDLARKITSATTFDGNKTSYVYDLMGNVVSITNPEGKITTYAYDLNGNLLSKEDNEHRQWQYIYDKIGRLTKATNPLSESTQYEYNALNKLTKEVDAKGNMKISEYDILGNQTAIIDKNNKKTSLVYDELNRAITTIAPDGGKQNLLYDKLDRLIKKQDALSNVTEYKYDVMGNLEKLILPNGGEYQYGYDKHGIQNTITDPLGNKTLSDVDLNGRTTNKTMPNGAKHNYAYDAIGRIISVNTPAGMSKIFTYDEKGNLAVEKDQANREISYSYDIMHRLLNTVNPKGQKTSYSYDSTGNISNVVTPMGSTTSYQYDALDRIKKQIDPVGRMTEYNYDVVGNIEKTTKNGGRVTSYAYDNVGNLTSVTNPLNQNKTMAYDSMNHLTSETNSAGKTKSFAYDLNGQLTAFTDKNGGITAFTYDSMGNLTSKRDPQNRKSTYDYDLINRLTTVVDGDNIQTKYAYDTVGNMTAKTDAEGRTTNYTYDLADRLTSVTNPLDEARKMTYDIQGKLSVFTNPDGTQIKYEYDKLDALVSKTSSTEATGQAMYGFDADGRKVSMTDVAGTTSYEYDAVGRITAVKMSSGGKILYSYDSFGNLSKLTYPDETSVIYEYDALDRLIQIIDRNGKPTNYSYDLAGNLVQVIRPNNTQTDITYDDMDKIKKLVNRGKGIENSSFEYTYDLSGNIIKEIAVQGTKKYTREYTYDNRGQITDIAENNDKLITSYTYTYDRVGNRIKEQEKSSSKVLLEISNVFNKADRLVESQNIANGETKRTTYEYDKNGNMTKKNMPYDSYMTYKYDNENRLTTIKDKQRLLFAALYDGNGDRIFTLSTRSNEGGSNDVKSHLETSSSTSSSASSSVSSSASSSVSSSASSSVSSSASSSASSQTSSEKISKPTEICVDKPIVTTDTQIDVSSGYKVDYKKKMIEDTMLIPNGINETNSDLYKLTGYINNINTQYTQALMEYGTDGNIGNVYDYGAQRQSVSNGGNTNYYAYDGRGSVANLTNIDGEVSMAYMYGAFGETTNIYNGKVNNPYQYNAEYVDDIPGAPDMQYLRARYYSPYEGRFFSQDTIFGDMMTPLTQNLYAYCHNNPMMFTDPSGRYEIPLGIKMAGPAAIASYEAGMKKNDPVNIAKKSIAAKKQKAEAVNIAKKQKVEAAKNPYNPTNGSNSASSIEYRASQSSSINNSSSSPSTDFGQADAMRRAEEARKSREAIEKKKQELNNKACTSVNGQKYAQELAEIYQAENEVAKIQNLLDTSNPATSSILTNDDVLSTLTQHQRINLISLSNEKNKIKSLNMDYIALTENDLRGQGIGVEDGSTELTLELYNFMYKNSRSGITLSDAEYNAQAKKRAELEATISAMLMASNLTGNMNNTTKAAEPPVTKPNTGNGAAEGAGKVVQTTRVGRWMSQAEYDTMVKTGKSQMSPNGNTTYVANPADPNAFKAASNGSVYVEFDIPTNSIYPAGNGNWGQIPGPGSLMDRLNQSKGLPPISGMPDATNIYIMGGK